MAVLAFGLSAGGCVGHRPAQIDPVAQPAVQETKERSEPEGSPGAGVYHVVQPGQTLWRIARAYGLTVDELAAANGLADPTKIDAGERLWVPGASAVAEVLPYAGAPGHGANVAGPSWIWPVENGRVLSYFGAPRRTHRHQGVDIGGRSGQNVYATRQGRVVFSGEQRGYGRTVVIDHGNGLRTLYGHNSSLLVRQGQKVDRGQIIARVGRSGNASTNHCHFEVRRNNVPVDPLSYVAPGFGETR